MRPAVSHHAEQQGATILDGLPESVIVEEMPVRLLSKIILRCRAVRKSWRGAMSTNDFMLAHHCRQPALPLIKVSPKNALCSCTSAPAPERMGMSAIFTSPFAPALPWSIASSGPSSVPALPQTGLCCMEPVMASSSSPASTHSLTMSCTSATRPLASVLLCRSFHCPLFVAS